MLNLVDRIFVLRIAMLTFILSAQIRAHGDDSEDCKVQEGSESLTVTGVGPNIGRCGSFPINIEIQVSGFGIDSAFGMFNAVGSFCFNTANNRVSNLKAVDNFLTSGDSITIEGAPYAQVDKLDICWSGSPGPVKYRVTEGTGSLANIRGMGTFTIATNITACNGKTLPSFVSFFGRVCF